MSDLAEPLKPKESLSIPGKNCLAYVMLPLRIVLFLVIFLPVYCLMLIAATLRAVYMRLVNGLPSQILKYGTYGNTADDGEVYPSSVLLTEPLDEAKLRATVVQFCSEFGIPEDMIEIKFFEEKPPDWPTSGRWWPDYFVKSLQNDEHSFNPMTYWLFKEHGGKGGAVCFHVWNNDPGAPTYVLFHGNSKSWDGSANFNFFKETIRRYRGEEPRDVFQKPEITKEAAAVVDSNFYFLFFLGKLPWNIAKNLTGFVWNMIRAAKWAGGNGLGMRTATMNWTAQESDDFYTGCKAKGVSPSAAMKYACVKAAYDVTGYTANNIVTQSSLQTRHFPVKDQESRDLVGDWLVGVSEVVPSDYTLEQAQEGYEDLRKELETFGPCTRNSFYGKAYGLVNSGAATFEAIPPYNDNAHFLSGTVFMNNYGVREIGKPFHTWNWNAPFWLGINTINVDGATTTQVGAMIWGTEVVGALRDRVDDILRSFMTEGSPGSVPQYQLKHDTVNSRAE